MPAKRWIITALSIGVILGAAAGVPAGLKHVENSKGDINLPAPAYSSRVSIEAALRQRRSVREYKDTPLTLEEISQLLWAAQGISSEKGYRTAPSAGALYPLEIYLAAGNVTGLSKGLYKYQPGIHKLIKIADGDLRPELAEAAIGQSPVRDAAAVLVFAAVYERTTVKYGGRGVWFVHMEAGNVSQNVYLQAVSLELGTVFIGSLNDEKVKNLLKMPDEERPLGVMPVGRL